jgi:hypothetical protein
MEETSSESESELESLSRFQFSEEENQPASEKQQIKQHWLCLNLFPVIAHQLSKIVTNRL